MILRIWRGVVRTDRCAEYCRYIEETGVREYRATAGNLDAQLVTRDLGDGDTEIMTLSWWESLDAIRGFAGDDIEAAHYYPEDDEFLRERDLTVRHFEVR